jgi:hypothetical protein
VSKPGERQSLAYVQNFSPVDFVSKKWVLCSFSRRSISWCQRLIPIVVHQLGIFKVINGVNTPLPEYPSQNAEYQLDYEVQDDRAVYNDVCSANQSL